MPITISFDLPGVQGTLTFAQPSRALQAFAALCPDDSEATPPTPAPPVQEVRKICNMAPRTLFDTSRPEGRFGLADSHAHEVVFFDTLSDFEDAYFEGDLEGQIDEARVIAVLSDEDMDKACDYGGSKVLGRIAAEAGVTIPE